ncbi:hypothetical protein [Anaerosporobacter sp.]|uniref:hypothetical protein n=1 Tax=Anaerosporobacter sp. TaxID=1872529 RepID=UPI00286ED725|nr:hypothetical protein [Anaerosporobacter sp.]
MKRKKMFLIPLLILLLLIVFLTAININNGEKKDFLNEIKPFRAAKTAIRIYDRCSDFPYENMEYINDEAYEFLKKEYAKIDFCAEFEKGNLEVYDYYREKFNRLLNNEVTFTVENPATGKEEEVYLNEFGHFCLYEEEDERDVFNLSQYEYYFFDIDGDSTPELCVRNRGDFIYIFKYCIDTDKYLLWYEIQNSYIDLNGTRKMIWEGDGLLQCVYELDENGEDICTLSFYWAGRYKGKIDQYEEIYMLGLPNYYNEEEQIELPEYIEKQGYYARWSGTYFFRVYEDQYLAVKKEFDAARDLSRYRLKEVTYTYEELFGEFN